jgi:hypothetical protein
MKEGTIPIWGTKGLPTRPRCITLITTTTLPALKQHINKYTIYCHITNNDMCTILIRDFSKEQHVLPEDDKQRAIETCRSLLSVLVF